jgi:hypothetical protein
VNSYPTDGDEVGDFFKRGDTGFNHSEDTFVRKYAIEAAKFNGGRIPELPADATLS